MSDIFFVRWMDVGDVVHKISRDDHSGIGDGQGVELSFPNPHRFFRIIAITEWSDLHIIEWKIAFAPNLAPAIDERFHSVGVSRTVATIAFALIPNRAAHREAD